ncbi:MAG: VPLPA-CTERM sorting domain-containing protein [Gammaproteobacteria bacterium]|nr:VPLPA-CTERM sorting domain-containing protein [Gammaproteobacteria bacterium]
MNTLKAWAPLLAAMALFSLVSSNANAATVTDCGTDVCFTYDNSTRFGTANVVQNAIFFTPSNFKIRSRNSNGTRSRTATLNITIETINPEFSMSQFFLEEQGDYKLDGESTSVSADGMLAVTSGSKTCTNTVNPLFPSMPCRSSNLFSSPDLLVQGALSDWSASSFIDLADDPDWGSDTSVVMTLQNNLYASSFAFGEIALIQKKFAGVGIRVMPEVPVPAAVWLMGSALGVLGMIRRRRTK